MGSCGREVWAHGLGGGRRIRNEVSNGWVAVGRRGFCAIDFVSIVRLGWIGFILVLMLLLTVMVLRQRCKKIRQYTHVDQ